MRMKRVLALCLAALMCAPCAQAELKKGDRGGGVLRVQDELFARGYLAEEGDGQYGSNTEAAVKAFQTDSALEVTGVVDDETYELLINGEEAVTRRLIEQLTGLGYLDAGAKEVTADALRLLQQANALEVTGEADEATLALLDSGRAKSDAQFIQERLIELGYLQGPADGRFGAKSEAALKLFQAANGLEETGVLSEDVRRALFSDSAVGDDLRRMQARLIELGYLDGAADGAFGPKSVSALKKFQRAHGLEETGEGDEATLAALFSADAKVLYPTLNSVSANASAIRRLQQRLIDLGFLDGRADGDYGAKTYDAVLACQKHMAAQGHEVKTDGEAEAVMQGILFGEDYSSYIQDVHPSDENSEVRRIERRLRQLGYMDAAADSSFDEYAVECLKVFQTDAGFDANGIADRAVIDALFSADAAQAKHYVLHSVRMGENSVMVEYAQDALIRMGFYDHYTGSASGEYDEETEAALEQLYRYLSRNGSLHAEAFAEMKTLSIAAIRTLMTEDLVVYSEYVNAQASPEEIARVQRRLRTLFYDVEADGVYGESTVAAVKAFQAANGLEATGAADRGTQAKLFSDRAVGNWTQYMLKVSIDDQRVYVYELNEDKQYRQIDEFICSTGLGDTTPRGLFSSTTEPLDRWHYFTEFECWAQYAWRIEGLIYFHSVIYSEKDESTLRMSSVYNLGHKASHGCVRLQAEDAKWIYSNCDAGTIVIIY